VCFDSGVLLGGNWANDNYQMDWNIYFDARQGAGPDSMRFAGDTWDKWHQRGHDKNSITADPLFVRPGQNDFGLQTDSPALKIGFKPIDLSAIGPEHGKLK
jgi:hypothetical protein